MADQTHDSAPVPARKYLIIFGVMVLATLMTAGASYIPFGSRSANVIIAMVIASAQAFLVLGHMMHLLSERGMLYGILAFTSFFLIFMGGLTFWAYGDLPGSTLN